MFKRELINNIPIHQEMLLIKKTIGIKKNYTQQGRHMTVDPAVIPLGSRVYIPQFNKVFVAEDTGGKIKGNRIDIYMKDYDTCMKWGIRNIDIYILD